MGKDNDKSGEKKPRPKRIFARIVNGILIVVYFALLLLSLLSIGFFAATVNRINGAVSSQGIQGCLLYSDNILNNSGACGFVTWGQAIVLVFALAFMAYLVIKILAGFKLLNFLVIIELAVNCIMILLVFCLGVVLSVGLRNTCDRLLGSSSTTDDCYSDTCASCTLYSQEFYGQLETSQATTWLEFAVLLGLIIFNLICLGIWIYGRKQARAEKHKVLKEEKTKEGSPVAESKEASQEEKFGEFAE